MIAAKQLGRVGIGFDRDPLACLIARTSTFSYSRAALERLKQRVLETALVAMSDRRVSLREARAAFGKQEQQFIQYWFPSASQKELFVLRDAIAAERDARLREFAFVVVSSLIIAKSAGASYAMDISRSRPHKRLDKPVIRPFDAWERRFDQAVNRLPFLDSANGREIHIDNGDVRSLPLKDESIDFVLTSPPYLNAIDYLRSHKFSLVWMEHELEALRELRGTMIGTERGLHTLDGLPPELENRLDERLQESRDRSRVRQYLSDFGKALGELERVLHPQGLAVLVVGPTFINENKTDAAELVGQLAEQHGLRLISSATRSISPLRRSLPPPALFKRNTSLASRMRREVLVVLRKKC